MYDASFDRSCNLVPAADRRILWALRIAALAGVVMAASAEAQLPGAPVLQNAWATPGFVGALNFAGGGDGSVYAAAVGWSPGSGRFQLSAGLGAASRSGQGANGTSCSGGVYGARAAMPFGGGAASSVGFAAFAGIGGGGCRRSTTTVSAGSPGTTASLADLTEIPVGAAVGWRRGIGSSHGLSLYATPAFVFFGGGGTKGVMRVALGADLGITNAIGVTVGADFGGTRPRNLGGPSGILYGLGVSYAFGRR